MRTQEIIIHFVKKLSELSLPKSPPVSSKVCKHLQDTLALAQLQTNTGFVVRHHHNPVTSKIKGKTWAEPQEISNMEILPDTSKKKVAKKKKPFSGVKVSQMLAAREAEKQRINQVGPTVSLSLLS